MTRIAEKFARLKKLGRKGFIPFVTAGDPDVARSLEIVLTLARSGADIIELGVPFSDPMADGPAIQSSSQRALENGVALPQMLDLVRSVRHHSAVPIVLFSYLNPILQFGVERLATEGAEAGIDGILITDVVDREAEDLASVFRSKGIDWISLIAPTTTDERLRRIAAGANGFIYAISRAGVTGVQKDSSQAARELVSRARKFTDLPIAVGFGVSTAEQIADVWAYADAAVVGSAIVRAIETSLDDPNITESVEAFLTLLLPERARKVNEHTNESLCF